MPTSSEIIERAENFLSPSMMMATLDLKKMILDERHSENELSGSIESTQPYHRPSF